MSWTEKKISLPSFLGSTEKHVKPQQEEGTGARAKEDPKILKCSVLKKIKKNNQFTKKFFVLYDQTSSNAARLVYFDTEKKHIQKCPPRREIVLYKCFNINRKQDSQDKNGKKVMVINLYTLDDCVQIGFDEREDELNEWLETMLVLQQGSSNFYGKKPKPNFDIIWQVNVKGFKPDESNDSSAYQWTGPHRLCVTPESALLYPLGDEKCVELPHPCIRNVMYNDKQKVLGLELGRTSPIGSGLLSLESEEKECVSNLHGIFRKSMIGANHRDIIGLPPGRYRSSSFSQDRGSKPRGIPHSHLSSGKQFRDKELSRNRTISEPVGEGGKGGHVTPEPGTTPRPRSVRYSPGILSPTSPVGSVSAGLSDDGTGSSNSIYDPAINGDFDPHIPYAPEVIPEESSGEVSIEFKRDAAEAKEVREAAESDRDGSSSLPRKLNIIHRKQPSLPDYNYMPMVAPPLPARNQEFNLSTSLPAGSTAKVTPCITSPTDSQPSSSVSSDYHMMGAAGGVCTPLISPESNYLPMDLISQASHSTPPKSTSSVTLVPNQTSQTLVPNQTSQTLVPNQTSTPIQTKPPSMTSPRSCPVLESSVAGSRLVSLLDMSNPLTVLTPPGGGKRRVPSGEGGYVIMSPGVTPLNRENSINEEPSSRAELEESLGGRWQNSPVTRRRSKPYPDSQRNSSCIDESETLWSWRLNEDADFSDDFTDQIGRSPVGPNDDYMLILNHRPSASTPRPISRVSPASSSSAMSGTPSSGSRLADLDRSRMADIDRLERVQSFLRDQDDDKVTSRPPRGEVRKWGRHIDIPSSKSSSRSNVSPFGRTPPSGASNSPTMVSRFEGWFRNRAGSVPSRPIILERRRHRTQSEGEKDAAQKDDD